MAVQVILLDIEGTTTDIQFVHNVLFPYASCYLRAFVEKNYAHPNVKKALADVQKTVQEEQNKTISPDFAIDQLLEWIAQDRKHPALKYLQGMVWETGYKNGDLQSHVYDDVPPALKRWHEQGLTLAIYSSGSEQAQKLLVGYTPFGDLNPHFSAYFDTVSGGPKKESASYTRIAEALSVAPAQMLFLSDHPDEITAARQAGCQVIQLLRDGQKPGEAPSATTFEAITETVSL